MAIDEGVRDEFRSQMIMPLALEMEQRVFAGFNADELTQFRGLLQRVRGQVGDLDSDGIDSGNYGAG